MKYLDGYPELGVLSKALSFSSSSLRVKTRIEAYSCKPIKAERRFFKVLEQDLASDLALSTSISPPEHHSVLVDSAFGPLDKRESRKTLWLLISTLNLAFPDHDFSGVNAEEFTKEESARAVLTSLSSALSHLRASGSEANFYRSFSSYPPAPAISLSTHPKNDAKANKSKPRPNQPFNHLSGLALHNKLRDLQSDGENGIPTHPFLRTVLDPIINLSDCEVYSYAPDLDSDPHAYDSEDDEEYTTEDDDEGSNVDDTKMNDVAGHAHTPWNQQSAPSTPASNAGVSNFKRYRKLRAGLMRKSSYFSTRTNDEEESFLMDEDIDSVSQTPTSAGGANDETGGLLWSSSYFFYNRKMKRILFVSCWGRKVGTASSPSLMMAQQKTRLLHPDLAQDGESASQFHTSAAGASLFARLGLALDASALGVQETANSDGSLFTVGSAPAVLASQTAASTLEPASMTDPRQSHLAVRRAQYNPFRRTASMPRVLDSNLPPVIRDTRKASTPIQSAGSGVSNAPQTPRSASSRPRGNKRRATSGGAGGRSGRRRKQSRKTPS